MKKLIPIFFIFLFAETSMSQCLSLDTSWTRLYNGTGNGADHLYDVKVSETSGCIYAVGESVSPGGAGPDLIVFKYSQEGIIQWIRLYDGPSNNADIGHAIALDDSDNVYVTGESIGTGGAGKDYVTIKFNSSGDSLWVKRYDGTLHNNDVAYSIFVDQFHNVYVTGQSAQSGGGNDYVTIKYTSGGVQSWVKNYNGGTASDVAKKVIADNNGYVYVTGFSNGSAGAGRDYLTIKYKPNGDTAWTRRYNNSAVNNDDEPNDMQIDKGMNVYVTGKSAGPGGGNTDIQTIKYDSSGNVVWMKRFIGGGNESANAIHVDSAGNVFLTGEAPGFAGQDIVTMKYLSDGTFMNAAYYDGTAHSDDAGVAIRIGKKGEIYVLGTSRGDGTGNDFVIVGYNPASGAQCVVARSTVTGASNEVAYAFAISKNYNCIIACGQTSAGGASYDCQISKFLMYPMQLLIEGFYNQATDLMSITDTVRIYLAGAQSPYTIVDSSVSVVDSVTFQGTFIFQNAPAGQYYFVVRHRNALETWSRNGGDYYASGDTLGYNFTNSPYKSYNNNLKLKGMRYCIYSGDINHDGVIDLTDIVGIFNDAQIFNSGYVVPDLNGDYFVDVSDIIIAFNNAAAFVQLERP